MNDQKTIQQQLRTAFGQVFPELDLVDLDFSQPRSQFENWDSLAHLQLMGELENIFSISFDIREVGAINSLADFIPLIEQKLLTKTLSHDQ